MRPLHLFALAFLSAAPVVRADDRKVEAKVKEIAGVAEFLHGVPKHFAMVQAVDPVRNRVTLLIEGDTLAKTWDLMPDGEVKVHGWWGRLDQLTVNDRVWVWFQTDRKRQPVAVMMIADELSEQDIHESVWTLTAKDDKTAAFHPKKGADRKLDVTTGTVVVGSASSPKEIAKGGQVYFQSAGIKADRVRLILSPEAFEQKRTEQKLALRKRWEGDGLPGTVVFLHQHSGEMELMLDHEAMRWGRSLKTGDSVTIASSPPIKAVVREVRPWRERTQLRLVAAAADQGDLRIGQRAALRMTPPPDAVQNAQLPPDLGRRTAKADRVEWFLASIYCTCLVRGNVCTGHFYTLASCNPNGCGQPNAIRKQLAKLIDDGKPDEQIFQELLKEHGPGLLKPHLLP